MRRGVALGSILAAFIALYAWTAATSDHPSDPYGVNNRVADAFLHGQLHVRLAPPEGLLRLKDPYDYRVNGEFRRPPVADLALYEDRLYAYWGPGPALLLFVPAHVAGVDRLSERWVTFALCVVALGLLALLLRDVVNRWAPRAPPWALALGLAVLATGPGELWLVRKPEVYTLAIAAGMCFVLAAVLAFLRALDGDEEGGPPRLALLALGSLSLGLAFGSRWTLAPALLAPVVVLALLWRGRDRAARLRLAAVLLGPMGACVLGLLAFNAARFDNPFETGQGLALLGFDARDGLVVAPSLDTLAYYFTKPLHVRAQFPYLWLDPKEPESVLTYSESATGLLWSAPVFLLGPVAWLMLRRRARPAALFVGVLVAGAAAIFAQHVIYSFAALRYLGDFAPLLVLAGVCGGVLLLTNAPPAGRRRTGAVAAGAELALAGVLVTVLLSVNGIEISRPGALRALQRFFAPVPTLASSVAGRPLLASVDGTPVLPRQPEYLLKPSAPHDVRVVAGAAGTALIRARLVHVDGLADGALAVRAVQGDEASDPAPVTDDVQQILVRVRRGLNTFRLELFPTQPVFAGAQYALLSEVSVTEP